MLTLSALFTFFIFILAVGAAGTAKADDSFITVKSKHDFNTTVTNIKKQTAANKLVLLKEYNVQMMLKMVGVNAEKSMTMAIFHPRYGKVIYANDKNAMSATPLRLIVQERGGDVIVAYIRPSAIFANFDLPKSMTDELDTLLGSVVKNATN